MARLTSMFLALILLACPVLAADDAPVAADIRPYQVASSNAGVTLTFDALQINWEPADEGGMIPVLPGAGELGIAGAPRLPVFSEMIAVPPGMDLVVDQVSAQWTDLGTVQIAHDPGNQLEDDADADPQLYAEAFANSQQTVAVSSTNRWRDLRVASVFIQPMRVNPETGVVQLASDLEVAFRFVNSPGGDGYDPPGVSEAMLPLYENFVVNSLDYIDFSEVTRGTYLIIYPDDWEVYVELLAQWRTRTGFTVQMAPTSETGTSFSSLHAYISNVYETADPALEYVVLVGDIDTPANIATSYIDPGVPFPIDPNIATDHKYTYDLAADETLENRLPRYFVGRISVDSQLQFQTVVAKIMQYETTPFEGNPDRWTRAVGIADRTYAISTKLTTNWVKYKMLNNGFTNVDMVIRESFGDDPGAQGIADAINNDVSWVTYRGFGSHTSWAGPYFYNSDIDSRIYNTDNVPVITSMVCGGGAFDETNDDPCFGEEWIRHGTANNPLGAVAFIAPSEIDTHTRWNNMVLGGWYTALFDQGLRSLGQCLSSAKLQLYNNYPLLWNPYGSNENSVWFYFHSYNILGDPALQLRAEIPKTLSVDHAETLSPNDTHLDIVVLDGFGTPVKDAWAVVTKDEDTILGMARTASNGVADILLTDSPSGGQIDLTVSRPDVEPYLYTLAQGADGVVSLLGTQALEIESDPYTNGDGNLNPGELINPKAFLRVEAPGGVGQMLVSMNVPYEYGEVITPYQSFDAQAEDAVVQTTDLRLRLRQNLPAGSQIPVTFSVYTDAGNMTHLARLEQALAPKLRDDGYTLVGSFLPGETTELDVRLANTGDVGAGTVQGFLTVDDPFVTVLDNEGSWPVVPAGASGVQMNDRFTVQVSDEAYRGHKAPATVALVTQRGHVQRVDFTLEVDGAAPDAPTGPAGPGYFIFEDIDTGYPYTPEFTWESVVGNGGVDVGLDDQGNNEDDVVTVNLPFAFPYWDEEFTQISICSNGWLSFGHSEFFFFRNRPIPGPLTPFAGIMPLWDDLIFASNNSGVYTYHDTENGWFTIEWHRVWHYNDASWWGDPDGPPMHFQVRLLDPAVHGAPGGLGMVAILYDDIQNDDGEENYLTMGITSPDGREALQYEFANTNPATADGVEDNRQLLLAAAGADWYSDPNINFAPPLVQLNATAGGQGSGEVTLRNTGGRATTYEVWPEGIGLQWGAGEGDEFGQPDMLGYRWYDSRESFGPDYQWINIAQPVHEVPFEGGDGNGHGSMSGAIQLPFAFPYYDGDFSQLWISESGYVTFNDPEGEPGATANTALPRPYAPLNAIFPYWDNIGIDEGGKIYARATQNAVIITWQGVHQLAWDDDDGPYTFQLVLTPDGAIHVQYGEMNGEVDSATIGLQDATGDIGLLTAFNTAVPGFLNAEDLSLRFSPGMPWLSAAPLEHSLSPGEEITLNLSASSEGLAPGMQSGRLLLLNRLAGQSHLIPVDFLVVDDALGYTPEVNRLPRESVAQGDGFTPFFLDPYVADWDDPDADIQWTSWGGEDSLLVTIGEDHQVSIQAHPDWTGPTDISFRAWDPNLNYTTVDTRVDRFGNNDSPRFDSATPDALGETSSGATIGFSVEVSDPEGDEVELEWYHNGGLVGEGASASISFDTIGDHTVRVLALDSEGNVSELAWTGNVIDVGVAGEGEALLPTEFAVERVYPNPFNAAVVLRYALPQASDVKLKVYNLLGREVLARTLAATPAGRHEIVLDASTWASGLYFLDWRAGGVQEVRKAVLIK